MWALRREGQGLNSGKWEVHQKLYNFRGEYVEHALIHLAKPWNLVAICELLHNQPRIAMAGYIHYNDAFILHIEESRFIEFLLFWSFRNDMKTNPSSTPLPRNKCINKSPNEYSNTKSYSPIGLTKLQQLNLIKQVWDALKMQKENSEDLKSYLSHKQIPGCLDHCTRQLCGQMTTL